MPSSTASPTKGYFASPVFGTQRYVCACVSVCACIDVCVYVFVYACACVYVYIICVCVYVCVCVYTYICMCVRLYVLIYIYIRVITAVLTHDTQQQLHKQRYISPALRMVCVCVRVFECGMLFPAKSPMRPTARGAESWWVGLCGGS